MYQISSPNYNWSKINASLLTKHSYTELRDFEWIPQHNLSSYDKLNQIYIESRPPLKQHFNALTRHKNYISIVSAYTMHFVRTINLYLHFFVCQHWLDFFVSALWTIAIHNSLINVNSYAIKWIYSCSCASFPQNYS